MFYKHTAIFELNSYQRSRYIYTYIYDYNVIVFLSIGVNKIPFLPVTTEDKNSNFVISFFF